MEQARDRGRTDRSLVIASLGRVHLIGIGGAGMSAIAKVLLARGLVVTGSDLKESRAVHALRALGAVIQVGHDAVAVRGAGTVVVSSAIPAANPELAAARGAGIPILQRAQVLAMLMRERRGIAVSGTHGKTTTTSMIAVVMQSAGLDPTFLIGGDLNETGTNAHHGSGEWLVAEADESDGSFLWLGPEIAVVTNVEADHLDYYEDVAAIDAAFGAFLGNVPARGCVIACADDPGSREVAGSFAGRCVMYGLDGGSLRGSLLEPGHVAVTHDDLELGVLRLAVPGAHNARNALAALAVSMEAGIGFDVAADALASFTGVARRFQTRGIAAGVTLVDDYAHHPTEVTATLASARERGWSRVIAVFQPHRYTRTRHMGAALGAALAAADLAIVTDVYGAGEDPEPGITGRVVVDGLLAASPDARVVYVPTRRDVPAIVAAHAVPGDLVLTIGAGDVTLLADDILYALATRT